MRISSAQTPAHGNATRGLFGQATRAPRAQQSPVPRANTAALVARPPTAPASRAPTAHHSRFSPAAAHLLTPIRARGSAPPPTFGGRARARHAVRPRAPWASSAGRAANRMTALARHAPPSHQTPNSPEAEFRSTRTSAHGCAWRAISRRTAHVPPARRLRVMRACIGARARRRKTACARSAPTHLRLRSTLAPARHLIRTHALGDANKVSRLDRTESHARQSDFSISATRPWRDGTETNFSCACLALR
mmetsp:Transcript_28387/g.59340  ORF Transcript_28387/g.59340 Transcript_28387/m.59340 type:complete len:249 (+) Transcript_28387:682-1428(+)